MADDLALKIPLDGDVSPISAALENMKSRVGSAMSNVRDAMGAVGIMAAGYLKGAVESAVSAQEATDQLKIKLEDQGIAWDTASKQVDAFTNGVKAMSTHTGGEAKEALNTLITRHVSLSEALKMQAPLTELAAAKNISLTDAANMLADAENGRMRGLEQLGVVTKDEVKNHIDMNTVLERLNKNYKGLSEEHMKTLPGQVELINRNFKEFTTSIGTALLPLITKVATALEKASEFIKKIDGPTREIIAKVLLATAVIGPLIGGLGLVQKVMGILGPVVSGLGGLIGGLTLPIIAIIAGIALLTVAYTKNWGGMKTFTDKLVKDLVKLFGEVVKWFKTNWPIIKQKFEEVIKGIQAAYNALLKPVLKFIVDEFMIVVNWVKENWPLIKETITNVINAIKSVIEVVLNWIIGFWKAHGETIMKLVSLVWDSIKTIIDTTIHVVLDIIKFVMDLICGHWGKAWNSLIDAVKSIFGGLGKILSDIFDGIGDIFADLAKTAIKWGENLINGFIDGIKHMAGKVKDVAHDVIKGIGNFLGFNSPAKEGEGRNIVKWGSNMISGFMDGIKSKLPDMQKLMSKAIKAPNLNANVNLGVGGGLGSSINNNNKSVTVHVDKFISQSKGDNKRTLQQLQFMTAL